MACPYGGKHVYTGYGDAKGWHKECKKCGHTILVKKSAKKK